MDHPEEHNNTKRHHRNIDIHRCHRHRDEDDEGNDYQRTWSWSGCCAFFSVLYPSWSGSRSRWSALFFSFWKKKHEKITEQRKISRFSFFPRLAASSFLVFLLLSICSRLSFFPFLSFLSFSLGPHHHNNNNNNIDYLKQCVHTRHTIDCLWTIP